MYPIRKAFYYSTAVSDYDNSTDECLECRMHGLFSSPYGRK